MRLYRAMILILLLACAAYLYRLHEPSYWLDEALSLEMSRDWDALWSRLLSYEANMWLYYIQLHFLQQGSQLEFYTRSFSVSFSLLSVALVYSLTLRLFKNRQTASISALVMGLNPFMLRYAQETRGYSETLFFATLATYLLIRAQENQRKLWWVGYGLCITIGLYLHLFIIWVALAHALWLLSLSKKTWGNWFLGAAVTGLGILSVLLFQPVFNSTQVDWIPPFNIEQLRDFLLDFTAYARFLQTMYIAAFLLAGSAFFRRRGEAAQCLLWLLLLLPLIATILVSISFKPLFMGRYFIIILAPFAILIALGISQLPKRWLLALFVGLTLFASLRSIYYTVEDRNKLAISSIREIYAYLAENATDGDIILFERQTIRREVLNYYGWRFGLEAALHNGFMLESEAYPQIWLIQKTHLLPESLIFPNYRFTESIGFGRMTLWRFVHE